MCASTNQGITHFFHAVRPIKTRTQPARRGHFDRGRWRHGRSAGRPRAAGRIGLRSFPHPTWFAASAGPFSSIAAHSAAVSGLNTNDSHSADSPGSSTPTFHHIPASHGGEPGRGPGAGVGKRDTGLRPGGRLLGREVEPVVARGADGRGGVRRGRAAHVCFALCDMANGRQAVSALNEVVVGLDEDAFLLVSRVEHQTVSDVHADVAGRGERAVGTGDEHEVARQD
jgi:hypothetical protein